MTAHNFTVKLWRDGELWFSQLQRESTDAIAGANELYALRRSPDAGAVADAAFRELREEVDKVLQSE